MSWPFEGLTPFKYGLILADPPWAYEMRSPKGYAKSPEAHYSTLSIDDITRLPVNHLAAPDCMLMMWSTWPHLTAALHTMKEWGCEYKTGGAWVKRTPSGKAAFGTGYLLRSATEPFLVGTIGAPRISSRSERNLIDATRREHSRKPDDMRRMCERLMPGAWRCELFGRQSRHGWDVWGDEARKFDGETP